nr:hypothetical protein [uncultured Mediterranean phage uvMED]
MELIPPLPIENKKENKGLVNIIDKSYFICDKLLAIFETSDDDKTFVFEFGYRGRNRLYISKEDLLKEHSESYVYLLEQEMPSTRIRGGVHTSATNQEWLDEICEYKR